LLDGWVTVISPGSYESTRVQKLRG
jgi:hypothetical protein